MPTKENRLLCYDIILDLRAALPELLERAKITWVSPKDKEAFLAHGWPAHQTEHAPARARCFAVVSTFNPEGALILHRALMDGKCVCTATLHEALALATFFRTSGNQNWTSHDFAIMGTRVQGARPTAIVPTVSLREGELYLGVERLSLHDPPSHILVTY